MIRAFTGAVLALAIVCAAPAGEGRVEAFAGDGTFRYRVVHPEHGEIGTYTNVVRRQGDQTSVRTRIDIEVKVAFVTAHNLEAERSETWSGDRLVRYTSTTRKNGEDIRVEGRADGQRFLIEGPAGRIVAPPSVAPTNAWSKRILDANVVMASESGRLYRTSVSGGGRETLEIDGEEVSTRHFRMQADTTYDIWFDDRGRVVRFTTVNDGDTVAFLLT